MIRTIFLTIPNNYSPQYSMNYYIHMLNKKNVVVTNYGGISIYIKVIFEDKSEKEYFGDIGMEEVMVKYA